MRRMASKKITIPVIFAAVGIVCIVWGMFGKSSTMFWMGVGLWGASVVSERLLKKKSKTTEEPHS